MMSGSEVVVVWVQPGYFSKFQQDTLFYIFYRHALTSYVHTFDTGRSFGKFFFNPSTELTSFFDDWFHSMPNDEAQLYAADEL